MVLWSKSFLPPDCSARIVAFFKNYFPSDNKYKVPAQEGVTLQDWTLNGKSAKAGLRDDKFWINLGNLVPRSHEINGCTVSSPLLNGGQPVINPVHRYLYLMRELLCDTLRAQPEHVGARDQMSLEAHRLFFSLRMPTPRYTLAMHVALWHTTSRLQRHGNLMSGNGEGGERTHQPHKRIAAQDPTFVWGKCPPAIRACVSWGVNNLALWRDGLLQPETWASHGAPTLPSI